MFGLLNINKPIGPTSHDMVAGLRRILPRRTKVGHAGTLDPFASGVLVICVGQATRLADMLQCQPKRYLAQITLGTTSTTDDPEGQLTPTANAPRPSLQSLLDTVAGFVGPIDQVPPAHSAVHVDGRRAYKLARRGEDVQLRPRQVLVHEIAVQAYDYPHVELDVLCGSGTYIRSLARDIGSALSTGGYCSSLTRTAVGPFKIVDSRTPDTIDPEKDLLPASLAVTDIPNIVLNQSQVSKIRLGQKVPLSAEQLPPAAPDLVAALDDQGTLICLARADLTEATLAPSKVFNV